MRVRVAVCEPRSQLVWRYVDSHHLPTRAGDRAFFDPILTEELVYIIAFSCAGGQCWILSALVFSKKTDAELQCFVPILVYYF